MKRKVKERLNERLLENGMATLSNEISADELEQQLEDRTKDGLSRREVLNNYYALEEPVYETKPTFIQTIVPGNEQLIIVLIFGFASYALYLYSKSKVKS